MSPKLANNSGAVSFGSYELLDKVATGGMAEVYRARARRAGGVIKTLCLKRIHPTLCADPSFVDMFIEEARLGLSMSHSNIVPVFDFGCIDGYHYLVMDYVEGHDLADAMARARIVSQPFARELAVFVVMQVLEGLAYAHLRKDENDQPLELVHRDVSPSNVMISAAGEVKILDFGIARSALREFQTRTGVVKGKPGYMAPEQARGDSLDARVDIYACGVMLHELLTGERPEAGSDDGDGDDGGGDESDRLVDVDADAIDDEDLEEIVARALDPEPDERFQTASDMRDALHEYLADRDLRPQAAGLKEHVESLFAAPAKSPDWSHEPDAVDRHLAAIALESSSEPPEPGGQSPVPTPPAGGIATRPSTERIDSERAAPDVTPTPVPKSPARRWGLYAAEIALGLAVVAAYFFWLRPDEQPEQPSGDDARATADGGGAAKLGSEGHLAHMELRTQPSGAAVEVDGIVIDDVTPTVVGVEPGGHRLKVRLPGHKMLVRDVNVEAGQQVMLDLSLTATPGTMRVTSVPLGAKVAVNGRPRGRTPLDVPDLDRSATYRVRVTWPGYGVWEQDAAFSADEEALMVHAKLTRMGTPPTGSGFLSVVVHPWGEVIIDGSSLGNSPIIRHSLRAGRHVVVVRHQPSGAEARRVVTIPVDDEVRVSVDLSQ